MCRFLDDFVKSLDIANPFIFEPAPQGAATTFGIDWNTFLPRGTATQNSREWRTGFSCQLQRFEENLVADARTEVDKWETGSSRRLAEVFLGLLAAVGDLSISIGFRAFDIAHIDGNLDLQHVDAILRFGEFLHILPDFLRFDAGERQAFLVSNRITVSKRLQEECNIIGAAFRSDTLNEGVFDGIDLLGIVRIVVHQDLYHVSTCIDQALHRPLRQQIGQTTLDRRIVAGFLVCQEQSRTFRAMFRRLQSVFRIQQNSACILCQYLRDLTFEFAQLCVCRVMALTFSNRFPQRAALVHRGCSNNSVLIGNGVYAVEFAPRYADFRPCLCHKFPPLVSNWSIQLSTSGGQSQTCWPAG